MVLPHRTKGRTDLTEGAAGLALRPMRIAIITLHVLLAVLLPGCGGDGAGSATLSETLSASGIDVAALFTPPSAEELDALDCATAFGDERKSTRSGDLWGPSNLGPRGRDSATSHAMPDFASIFKRC